MLSQKYVLTIFHRYPIQNTSIRIPSEQKKIIPINEEAIKNRKKMLYNGTILISLVINKTNKIISKPVISSKGFFNDENVKNFEIDNYLSETGLFKITKAKKFIGEVKSEQRFYPVEKTKTTEAGIFNFILSDIYITMGEGNLKEGWVVKAYFNPLVKCLWFGAFIMAIGGILSLFSKTNRKYI